MEGKIQRFVANSVPNLDPNDVTVIMSMTRRMDVESPSLGPLPGDLPEGEEESFVPPPSQGPPLVNFAGLTLSESSRGRFKVYAIFFLILLMLIAVALLLNVYRFSQYRRRVESGGAMEAQALEKGHQNQGLLGGGPEGGGPGG